jgi:hypothetical protein
MSWQDLITLPLAVLWRLIEIIDDEIDVGIAQYERMVERRRNGR